MEYRAIHIVETWSYFLTIPKDVHEACILNDEGGQVGKYIRIKNFKSSIEKFRQRVESTASELDSILGLEWKPREYTGIPYIVNFQNTMKSISTILLR